MTASITLTMSCFVIAIVCCAITERSPDDRWPATAWLSLLAAYGTSVGIVATLIIYFFSINPLVAIIVGIPAGVPAFVLFIRMAEG